MFTRVASIIALATFALAAPAATTNQCNTGSAQCCNTVDSASSPQVATVLGLLGIVVGDITGQVGLQCSPLSVLSSGGGTCNQEPVCCTNNSFNGLVNLGCSPINVGL
ncbi:fungal hydrophobin [Coniophora puteana RWD-64-598 SS2]|uniref:Hydrophobin n=1 Tax=Coniophora puteana (strain RWD-64-598) TaxID=741705 RepID=A0A5M3MNM1_CONPW|nr:fungal hydrophobin [Coniophora puteana RWD-64-598 SS2]EIW80221.1 fungal hydrophobin [Coniophora puteana RWD-64-598 SS2]